MMYLKIGALCAYMCMCMHVCNLIVNIPMVFPSYWAMALLIAQYGTDALASHTVPSVSVKKFTKKGSFQN